MSPGRGSDGRWPSWVYDAGEEPDYRFTFANERTFLAWVRTALALLAAGVALDVAGVGLDPAVRRGLAVAVVLTGMVCAAGSWVRWARAERAMRVGHFLPSSGLSLLVSGVVVGAALTLLVAL
ncbi:DUF202 domain-containing protein [Nocardioides albidus]|uniref:DUF202 domain-containing protein n=1 Tax=Nocardioides albidus TaxID=1517589 RepID=A0A5C4VYW7_9ACTN|nr:DUF202 domain-containing protein [Nocardioides albidus]TNM41184.1 DUF202 domain-containing protein [Nocardioides albidus]